jgi:hypothetical protein
MTSPNSTISLPFSELTDRRISLERRQLVGHLAFAAARNVKQQQGTGAKPNQSLNDRWVHKNLLCDCTSTSDRYIGITSRNL